MIDTPAYDPITDEERKQLFKDGRAAGLACAYEARLKAALARVEELEARNAYLEAVFITDAQTVIAYADKIEKLEAREVNLREAAVLNARDAQTLITKQREMFEAREKELRALLNEAANICEKWAEESRTGGWSTHQVRPNKELADKLRRAALKKQQDTVTVRPKFAHRGTARKTLKGETSETG